VGGFPLATFLVNVTGAFGLGLVAVLLLERLAPTRYLRPLLGIGFFGAPYTTFSTMAMEGVRLLDQGRPALAVGYWLATLLVGQMAGVYGMWLGRLRPSRRRAAVERRGQAAAHLHR
jgi:CrcB protein